MTEVKVKVGRQKSRAKFRVEGASFDGERQATVQIDRGSLLFSVRPHRRRRDFVLPLSTVAEMVIWRVVKAEAVALRRQKAKVRP